ncbi:hypothetical protein C1T17_02815 [Sphingobium sp. SCG-1]|uniref:hydantoinase B/oxoprolinase family protein n=1 Tax=Sphingobium sp. SCG-1 TaxID=2072936 RepID=UPI000CD6ABE2|nr:hydantoinase B/oxoprolinase family protein [Sphingobium sp. SCG-1]AUW57178.1 hypothetical protein C1T17_02815 [Sphingobium sp. SCG-1]
MDPITTEVVGSRLREAAATMEHVLYHSGYSHILRESKDGTAGLTDPQGRVVMLGGGLKYHLGAYEQAVCAVLERFPAETLKEGDSFVGNDPYICGSPHASDYGAITPAFHEGVLIGFGVSVAHKSDIGGIVPGSAGAAAREIYHDGVILPPVRFQTPEGVVEDVAAIIANNSRVPDVVLGDLRAQVGATRVGAARLKDLCDEYGRDTVLAVQTDLIERASRQVSSEIAQWRDTEVSVDGFMDYDEATATTPVRVALKATKIGSRLILDFTGSAGQSDGPVNLSASTTRSVALLGVVAASDPSIPINAGIAGPVEFILPEGSIVNASRPATVNLYFPPAHMVYNLVLSALSELNPKRAVAPSGLCAGAVSIGYAKARSGKPAVLYDLFNTALGGVSSHDGAAIVQPMNHFTPGTAIELVESEYPLRVRAFEMLRDSAGAGRFRGGSGYAREYELLEDASLTIRSSSHQFTAAGVLGGAAASPSRVILKRANGEATNLYPLETRPLLAGDIIRFERGGGAGYGNPAERSRDMVQADVDNGYVSLQAAGELYGFQAGGDG